MNLASQVPLSAEKPRLKKFDILARQGYDAITQSLVLPRTPIPVIPGEQLILR